MRTAVDRVNGRAGTGELCGEPTVDGGEIVDRHPTERDATLVRYDDHPHALLVQAPDRCRRAGKQFQLAGVLHIVAVGGLAVQCAIAV
jgi:hypothetical protein